MKTRYFLLAILMSLVSLQAHSAGSPLNESFTNLIALSNQAIEIGKKGDKDGFIENINVTLEALKEQNDKGSSIRLQRANTKLKDAKKAAKAGNLPEAIADVEQAIVDMQVQK